MRVLVIGPPELSEDIRGALPDATLEETVTIRAAATLYQKGRYDVVLLHARLADSAGVETAEIFRRDICRCVPVVMLVGEEITAVTRLRSLAPNLAEDMLPIEDIPIDGVLSRAILAAQLRKGRRLTR